MGRLRPKIFLQVAAVALVAALLGIFGWQLASRDSATSLGEHVNEGKTPAAPSFELDRLGSDGKLSLASLRGKAVVLNFWASWCGPCKEEAPRLQEAALKWAKRGVVVVGVDSQDFTGDARRFARRYGMTYPLVHDGPGKIRDAYGVSGFPETFFVDRRGRIVGDHIQGPVSEDDLERNIELALRA